MVEFCVREVEEHGLEVEGIYRYVCGLSIPKYICGKCS